MTEPTKLSFASAAVALAVMFAAFRVPMWLADRAERKKGREV